jgi:hypothetical protein
MQPSPRATVGVALALCWALVLFDLALGGVAAVWPELYLRVMHPEADVVQVALVRRTGMLWLAFAAVALCAATVGPDRRGHWFLILAVVRLLDVPADVVSAVTMPGATTLSRLLVLGTVPVNLGLGLYFYLKSRRLLLG